MNDDARERGETLVPGATDAEFGEPEPLEPDPIEPAPPTARVTDEPAPRRRMRRAWGRGALGVAVSGAAVVAVMAGAVAPWPTLGGTAASLEVAPAPSETVLACEGPILALGRDVSAATAVGIAAPAEVTAGVAGGGEPVAEPLEHPDVAGDDGPVRFVQTPSDRAVDSVAAASSARLAEEDLAGFAASACRPPQLESWIVGGDTAVGEADILLISNPGQTSATVQLTVYGATEPAVPRGFDAVPIPAGTQRAIPLAGIAGAEASPVVRVTATGAPVSVALQSSLVRTLDPVGLDRQGPVTAGERQRFPGVVVTDAAADGDDPAAIVRVMSRGASRAEITAVPVDGDEGAGETVAVPLEADHPVSVDLGDLPAGRYEVTVAGDGPLLAAVWQTTGPGREADFAWQTPSPELTEPTLFAVPDGPRATLHVSSPAEDVTVTVTDTSGTEQELTVPQGSSAGLALDEGELYTIDSGGVAVHAAVGYSGSRALAFIPVWPDPAAPEPLTIYP